MWKSTASWARGTEGNTAETGGAKAYKKRLSFPPVHGFREWSVKQCVRSALLCMHSDSRLTHFVWRVYRENPPPGSKFQAGSRLLTECRDPIPAEVASDISRELGDRLYAVYSEAMKVTQRPEREPIVVDKMFRFEDAWQGSSRPQPGKEVIIDHKRELRRAGPMGKTTALANKPGGGHADPRWTDPPGAKEHMTQSVMQRSIEVPKIKTLTAWFDQYGKPLRKPPPGYLSEFHASHKIVGTVGKSNTVNCKKGRIFMPGHVEDLGMY